MATDETIIIVIPICRIFLFELWYFVIFMGESGRAYILYVYIYINAKVQHI